ncbi:ubiquitin-conjugating enzyme E2 27-like [Andrographis paniculata]|uniref:ubiquitin-conjugating enzyme E2 27-like n=1 Tax=Andrographis paniculata TaxID=175694 RepID=UPI0021E6FEFC|nr:ubiquitin-conjugating enzyme E2 27-like [Andrographis paniculata]
MERRVQRELYDHRNSYELKTGIKLVLCCANDLSRLVGTIPGPCGTPYEGGFYEIEIVLPGEYPYLPPKMRFITKVWHPNISSQTGAICLDVLGRNWSPAQTMVSTLISLQALLSTPEPNDPQDAEVAKQYKDKHDEYVETARSWVATFAQPSKGEGPKNSTPVEDRIMG